MKDIKNIENDALIEYAENNIEIEKLENEIKEKSRILKVLKEKNNEILETGKKPVFNSDDIPF